MSLPFKHPFTAIISGPTSSGKTEFIKKCLRYAEEVFDTKFDRILIYFGEWQPAYMELGKGIEFKEGLPQSTDYSNDIDKTKLIIVDDLMREASSNVMVDLFTKGSHHKNLSVMFITQNVFHQGAGQRDISLNTNYMVLFKNPRDRAQVQHLARQVCPENPKFLQEAYFDATSRPFGYLLLDLKQSTPENCRFRTNIFPDDRFHYVYVPVKNQIKGTDPESQVPVYRLQW